MNPTAVSNALRDAVKSTLAQHGLDAYELDVELTDDSLLLSGAVRAATAPAAPAGFAEQARLLGLPVDCYGQTFLEGQKTLTIVGLDTKRRKNPVLVETPMGAKYVMSVIAVLSAIGDEAGQAAAEAMARSSFVAVAARHAIPATAFGARVVINGTGYTLCDAKPASRQYPFVAARDSGVRYKLSVADVKSGLERAGLLQPDGASS